MPQKQQLNFHRKMFTSPPIDRIAPVRHEEPVRVIVLRGTGRIAAIERLHELTLTRLDLLQQAGHSWDYCKTKNLATSPTQLQMITQREM